ncbi:MAG: TetR/AcrR family transcriptional regulator [Promicromonosporaceae bacterium]|nr:TetR/AcrR family transcriptional regulator [Promicromonosporaceae bacterium]
MSENSSTDDLRSASRALRDAISGLSRALGQGLSDVSADVGREIAAEIEDATRALSRELSGGVTPPRRATKAEQTRADLIEGARRVFAAKGYEAASVTDLAKEAGYTKGALYTHFASKEELFLTVIREVNDQSASMAQPDQFTKPGEMAADPLPGDDEIPDVLLSLEAYLYALRHPERRQDFVPMAEASMTGLATQLHFARTGEVGEPTREELEVAMGLASLYSLGGIMARILPEDYDVAGTVDRLGAMLVRDL